jgi:hypothetical protein
MRQGMHRALASWLDALRKIGYFFLLVAGSAGLGFVIAWPLWSFATGAREIYTITVLAILAAGIVFLIVRAIIRGRARPRDPGAPRRNALTVSLTVLIVILACAGAYAAAVLCARRMWILAVPSVLVWVGLLTLLAFLRRLARRRKEPLDPAENRGE